MQLLLRARGGDIEEVERVHHVLELLLKVGLSEVAHLQRGSVLQRDARHVRCGKLFGLADMGDGAP